MDDCSQTPVRDILQITSALPPAVCGVGDYSVGLADALFELGVKSTLLAAGTPHDGRVALTNSGFSCHNLGAADATMLERMVERLATEVVVLHFSGYGYARWGLCFWLIDGLRRWKEKGKGRRLITVFHELYASGPPWRMSFWTSIPQQRIARSLTHMSNAIVCTSGATELHVSAWCRKACVCKIPVFSNVGEIEAPRPLADRAPIAIVFGRSERRHKLYKRLEGQPNALSKGFARLGVEKIIDIGPSIPTPRFVGGVPVEACGIRSSDEISAQLADARLGLVNYPTHVGTKSGIMAAYLAHQLLCVNVSTIGELADHHDEGRQFIDLTRFADLSVDVQGIAAAGYEWYQNHSKRRTAILFRRLINDSNCS